MENCEKAVSISIRGFKNYPFPSFSFHVKLSSKLKNHFRVNKKCHDTGVRISLNTQLGNEADTFFLKMTRVNNRV